MGLQNSVQAGPEELLVALLRAMTAFLCMRRRRPDNLFQSSAAIDDLLGVRSGSGLRISALAIR
jgi:hypothetical protein